MPNFSTSVATDSERSFDGKLRRGISRAVLRPTTPATELMLMNVTRTLPPHGLQRGLHHMHDAVKVSLRTAVGSRRWSSARNYRADYSQHWLTRTSTAPKRFESRRGQPLWPVPRWRRPIAQRRCSPAQRRDRRYALSRDFCRSRRRVARAQRCLAIPVPSPLPAPVTNQTFIFFPFRGVFQGLGSATGHLFQFLRIPRPLAP